MKPFIIPRAIRHSLRPSPSQARYFSPCATRRSERQWSTPLARRLHEAISTTGSVPLASYMRMCLTGDLGGYYTGAIRESGRDQFGAKGDFVTSPEISQVFGELIGIWFVAEWISQGRPARGVQLIEVGPGRGTLMDDVLRTIRRFPAMVDSIESVFMVEASPELRRSQKTLLCGPDAAPGEHRCVSKHGRVPIEWTDAIKSIPVLPDKVPFIIAHEFFDALPIHIFQSARPAQAQSETEWREMMVSTTPPPATHTTGPSTPGPPPEFQLVLSSGTTRHSRYLPESSPRYRSLKQSPGSIIEVCPEASVFASDFAVRIGGSPENPKPNPAGAALILDYGTSETVPINSLRGIRQHRIVNPFSAPGMVDLSADVDFSAIVEAATLASHGVEVHGPVPQGDFLERMGIRQRAAALLQAPGVSESTAEDIEKAWRRLVDKGPSGMGKVYKALAILPENDGRRRPVGFGGDVAE